MNSYHELINKICEKKGINCTILSKDWILVLERNGITKYISGYKFDLNSHGAGNVVDDKYAFYEVLKYRNIPVAEHTIMFNFSNHQNAVDFFNKENKDIVIKANIGTCGNEVYHVKNISELEKYLDILLKKNFSISLLPYYNIKREYRVIVLNGKCRYIYGKEKPTVVGDGKNTIKELLEEFNRYYFTKERAFYNSNYDLQYVPKINEVIEYGWKFNLSKGSKIVEVEDSLKEFLSTFAINVAEAVNLKFGSVDIIETEDNKFMVLEANSGVMMNNLMHLLDNGYNIAEEIYSEAIDSMFSNS